MKSHLARPVLDPAPAKATTPAESPTMPSGRGASNGKPKSPAVAQERPESVMVGTLVGFAESGDPLVTLPAALTRDRRLARSTIPLDDQVVGREVVLLFEGGAVEKPIIMGLIQRPQPTQTGGPDRAPTGDERPLRLEVDGERLVFTAEREIVLRCGKASLTLTRAGKVLIRGTYILSRSSGAHRIKGASVQIN